MQQQLLHSLYCPPLTLTPRWSLLGQSFGGFCATTYLSLAPNSESQLASSCRALRKGSWDASRPGPKIWNHTSATYLHPASLPPWTHCSTQPLCRRLHCLIRLQA